MDMQSFSRCAAAVALALVCAAAVHREVSAAWAADPAAQPTQQLPIRTPHGVGAARPGKQVVEVGDFTATIPALTAEFAYLPPGVLRRFHDDDSAARSFAIDYYGALLFAHDARDHGLYDRNPGLQAALAAQQRKMVSIAYLRDLARTDYEPTREEIEQYYALHGERLCRKPARYRLARLGVVIGKNAGEAERTAAQQRLAAIEKRLDAGDPFAEVAEQASDLQGRGPGGEVGWLTEEDLRMAAGREAITGLAKGARTPAIETPRGREIYLMLDREEARLLSADECKPALEQALVQEFNRDIRFRRMDEIAIALGASMNIDAVVEALRAVPRPADP